MTSLRSSLLVALLIALASASLAPLVQAQGNAWQQSLRVLNPQRNWHTEQGTVEEATLTVHPKGVYAEIGLYLTISARSTSFSAPRDTLEAVYRFQLPHLAAFTDSWLWFDGEILRAELMDVETARDTYEGIVDRRQDPSILYKHSATDYELRIYPLVPGDTRRVKLTYLIPMEVVASHSRVPVPHRLLEASRHPVDLRVTLFPQQGGMLDRSAELLEHPERRFQDATDQELGPRVTTLIPAAERDLNTLTLATESPFREQGGGFFRSAVGHGDGFWYQFAALPSDALKARSPRRVVLLLDRDAGAASIGSMRVQETVRRALLRQLTGEDSLAVFATRGQSTAQVGAWDAATPEHINALFDALSSDPVASHSDLVPLLQQGLLRAKDLGASVVLASSNASLASVAEGDAALEKLASLGNLPPVHVVDFSQRPGRYSHGGQVYFGNDYFYDRLAESGSAHATEGISFALAFSDALTALRGALPVFTMGLTQSPGLCFDPVSLSPMLAREHHLDRAIVQVGRCTDAGPSSGYLYAQIGGQTHSEQAQFGPPLDGRSDTTLAALWASGGIAQMERESATSDFIKAIIERSLEYRVLSRYTAFLALEPSMGGEVCGQCSDESGGQGVGTESAQVGGGTTLEAFPNPTSGATTALVRFAAPTLASDVRVEVYSALGQRIRTLQIFESGLVESLEIDWDGLDDAGRAVASGTYLLIVTTPEGRYTVVVTVIR